MRARHPLDSACCRLTSLAPFCRVSHHEERENGTRAHMPESSLNIKSSGQKDLLINGWQGTLG
jgi:hypothetical protein